MLQRIASVFVIAAVLIVGNGCCCTHPSLRGDAAICDGCGIEGCDSCGYAAAPCLADCANRMLSCRSGCGEVYWGPQINDPVACCDPCDNCGNWTGGACCAPICNPLSGLRHLWGYRYAPGCSDVGFDAYGEPAMEFLPTEGEIEQQAVPPVPQPGPTPAKQASRKRHVRHATYWRPAGK